MKLYTFAIFSALVIGAFINLTSDTPNQKIDSEIRPLSGVGMEPLSSTEVDGGKVFLADGGRNYPGTEVDGGGRNYPGDEVEG